MKTFMVLLSATLLASHVRSSFVFPEGDVTAEPTESRPDPPAEPLASPPRRRISPRPPVLDVRQTPKCANNPLGICTEEDPDEYPRELIRRALGNVRTSVLSEMARGDEPVNDTLGQRFGGSVHDDNTLLDETAACAASEQIIFPSRARNSRDEWLYIANTDGIRQGVRVETCLDEGKPCRIGDRGTTCRQKYIYRKLLAMDASMNLNADNFRIPSSCGCYIKNEFLQLNTRFKPASSNSTKSVGSKRRSRSSRRRSRSRRQTRPTELDFTGAETEGLSGSPLDSSLAAAAPEQGTAQQSIETEETLNPSDTIGTENVRYAGEIVVESNPIVVQKKTPKKIPRRRN